MKGKGIVLNEPSIVAFDRNTKKIVAIGKEAQEMLGGRTAISAPSGR